MKSDYVIIGAGISGCSIAYNLAKAGAKNIAVIDKDYLTAGSTGRCGAGVRQQWGTKMNCLLARESIRFFEIAQSELDYPDDIEFKQEGYLIVAVDDEEDRQFGDNVRLQQSLDIPARKIDRDEAVKIVPHLNKNAIASATFCPTDGHLNPFKMTDAYYRAACRLGVKFYFYEKVQSILTDKGSITAVITDRRKIETARVINAAGGYARAIGQMVGVNVPVYPEKHEILVTEPVEKIQGPMVISFGKNIYCQQVPHGGFIMGRSDPDIKSGYDITSSWLFLDEMAKTVCELLPSVGNLRIIRQWAGLYAMAPDRQPIIGEAADLSGFYLACGFSGHGFMFAPMTGLLLAEIILNKEPTINITELGLSRFKDKKEFVLEKSVV